MNIKEKIDAFELKDHSFNQSDIIRNEFMLKGGLSTQGYDWWWHSFTAHNAKTGEEKPFFIEFFCINPGLGQKEPVFGQLEENKKNGIKPSYMMVKVGAWGEDAAQLNRFFGWDEVTIKEGAPYLVSADNCFCSETRTLGKVEISEEDAANHPEWMTQPGKMIWDLTIDKKIAFNVGYGAGVPMREAEMFEMFWHAEGMKTEFSGKVYWNDEEYIVDKKDCYGYSDKNWGKDFTSPWVWLSSNHIKSKTTGQWLENTAFDIGGGRPRTKHVTLERKLLGALWLEGEAYEYNFSKFWTLTKTKFKAKESKDKVQWKVIQETPLSKMETEVSCLKKDMLLINYESPDGEKRHKNLWNGGNGEGTIKIYKKILKTKSEQSRKPKWEWQLVDELEAYNIGCEYGEYK